MARDMTQGNETKAIVLFSLPMIAGNLFQQLYNVADTVIVGKFIGADALAAVGSSYTLMVFMTSIILGLCMGSGAVYSFFYGSGQTVKLKQSLLISFIFIFLVTLIVNIIGFLFLDDIMKALNIHYSIYDRTKQYLTVILCGMMFTFIYNFFCAVLRSMGDSFMPLVFLIIAALINIILDYIFVVHINMDVKGAAIATIIAQFFSAVSITVYCLRKVPEVHITKETVCWDKKIIKLIVSNSVMASIQQSIMNFGILIIQGLINSFGVVVMAGFAAAAKIDSFAYMPVQDFGNALSTYIAQNRGAGNYLRIKKGMKSGVIISIIFCAVVSVFVNLFAENLMLCFVNARDTEVIQVGVSYLNTVSIFYFLIGLLFLLYGFYRGIGLTWMSIVLTVISLGSRVMLAYVLSDIPKFGLWGIWIAIPIGWFLADAVGFLFYKRSVKLLNNNNKHIK